MKLSRETEVKIKFMLEQLIPPIIRDAHWFNIIPFTMVFGDKSPIFFDFKSKVARLTTKQYTKIYDSVSSVEFTRVTNLNNLCLNKILESIKGDTVLEVGCGEGFLAKKISELGKTVSAVDIRLKKKLVKENPHIKFKLANVEKLPFKNKSFDTVVCTHTLEHVQNLFQAIEELRRVTKKQLLIVVPKERAYKYTFNLHVHFFPYPHSLIALMGTGRKNFCVELGGDLFYREYV